MKKILLLILALMILLLGFIFYFLQKENEISSFSTSLSGRNYEEIKNIALAAEKLNNTEIKAGGVFSFNKQVGPRKPGNFLEAKTFGAGKIEPAAGGGVCQASSTVYNAALWAGLKITERHPHNIAVNSVGPGLDATVSYGFYDLKFKNTYDFPIRIIAKITGSRLIINIVGACFCLPLQRKINIFVEQIPTYDKIIHTRTYREITTPGGTNDAGGAKSRELISEDRYN